MKPHLMAAPLPRRRPARQGRTVVCQRYVHPAVTPLELDQFEAQGKKRVAIPFQNGWAKGVTEFLQGLHDGTIRLKGKNAPDLRRLDGVVVMGGWAEDAEERATLTNKSLLPIYFPPNPRSAALDALPFFGDPQTTMLCDVGKNLHENQVSQRHQTLCQEFYHVSIPFFCKFQGSISGAAALARFSRWRN